MSLGENSLVAAHQGKGQLKSRPSGTRVVTSLFLNLDSTQIQFLLLIQNSLARAVTRTPRHHHITPVLKSLHWLKIPVCIHFKVLSLTYNSLQSPQPTYLHKLFTIQPTLSTRSSSCLTLSRPLVSSHVLQLNHIHLCTTSLE